MGKKYFDTKAETLESSILSVWAEAAKKVWGRMWELTSKISLRDSL